MKPLYILLAIVSALSTAILWTNLPKESESPPTYGEMFRPYYHFSPPKNWMNDPNGLTFINGKYHMYYQYNPYNTIWGNMSWGHASSEDLVYWENLPVAIDMYEIPGYGEIGIFSGCNVIDVNNTSGMCDANGCLLAFYTAFSKRGQAQAMAYSNDGGMSYTQFIGNPIIDLDLQNFRDPKVFYYAPDSKWVMIVALSNAFKIQLYYSRDLIKWTYMSDFGPDGEELGIWEDPDLYELPIDDQGNTKWVLAHSIGVDAVQYYIGDFDGTTFTNTETEDVTLIYDYGFDFSEAATWNNEPQGRRLIIAWLNEGIYGGDLPTKVWRGSQTLIRQLTIRRYPEGLRVVSEPIPELQKLRDQYFQAENIEVLSDENVTLEAQGVHMEIIAEFAYPTENVPSQFGFRVLTGDNQTTLVGYDTENQLLFVDRSESGLVDFDPNFHSIINTTLTPENGTIQLHIFLDSCSVEVFANNGKIAMTNLIFPDPTKDKIELFAVGGGITLTSLEAWTLKSIWDTSDTNKKPKENEFLSLLDRVNSYIKS